MFTLINWTKKILQEKFPTQIANNAKKKGGKSDLIGGQITLVIGGELLPGPITPPSTNVTTPMPLLFSSLLFSSFSSVPLPPVLLFFFCILLLLLGVWASLKMGLGQPL